ncbi:YraN family protein [Actinomyces sp. F1_1611]
MTKGTNQLGRRGEAAAERYLTARGLKVLQRNWRDGPRGEIDLILQDGATVVFVEVKTRRGGEVAEVLSPAKRFRLTCLAAAWLRQSPGFHPYRIDLVGVQPGPQGAQIHWWKGIDR